MEEWHLSKDKYLLVSSPILEASQEGLKLRLLSQTRGWVRREENSVDFKIEEHGSII